MKKTTQNKIPMRKCIGCNESKPKQDLIRIAYYEGELTVDPSGRAKGRGVYLCQNQECRENALKRNALQRSFKTNFDKEKIEKVYKELANEQE